MPKQIRYFVVLCMIVFLMLGGCGGGGGDTANSVNPSGSPSIPSAPSTPMGTTLSWSPPDTFTDETALNPTSDLSQYEVYVNTTGVFSESDEPSAIISAADTTGNAVTTFDLLDLPFTLSPDVTYYVSMKSVSSTGLSSDFASAFSFML